MDTHDLAEQDDVLTANEEQTDPLFRKHVLVIYPLDRIFQHQIGYRAGGGEKRTKRVCVWVFVNAKRRSWVRGCVPN